MKSGIIKICVVLLIILTLSGISTAQLSDSWSKFQGKSLQNTAKSVTASYINGTVDWMFPTDDFYNMVAPVVNTNNEIYVFSETNKLYKVADDGNEIWNITLDEDVNPYVHPAIGSDGVVYICSDWDSLYAIFPNGTQKWKLVNSCSNGLTISDTNIIYTTSYNGLMAIYNNGGVWYVSSGQSRTTPAILNGIIYYTEYPGSKLTARYLDGTLVYRVDIPGGVVTSPTIGQDGTIYLGFNTGTTLRAYWGNNGTEKWNYSAPTNQFSQGTSIDSDELNNDRIYFGNRDGKIYSLFQNGTVNWIYNTGTSGSYVGNPAIDGAGDLYFTGGDYNIGFNGMYKNGTLKFQNISFATSHSTPAIANDGKMYIKAFQDFAPYEAVLVAFSSEQQETTYSISGNVKYRDTDNSLNNLQNALVYLNSTVFDYTDASGNYELFGLQDGNYVLTYSYPITNTTLSPISTDTKTISISGENAIQNIQLLYSKPAVSTPKISGNFITGTYSHNFKTINLWENPNFVWGAYTPGLNQSITETAYRGCNYDGSNVFSCPKLTGFNYSFNFLFSDVYNYYLSSWHPALSGSRNFTSPQIFISTAGEELPTEFKFISRMDQKSRENYLKDNSWDILFLFLIWIGILYVVSWGKKR